MSAEKLLQFLSTTSSLLKLDGVPGSYGVARLLTITSPARVLEIGVNESAYWSRASVNLPFLGNSAIWYAPAGSYYRAKVTESPRVTWFDLADTYVFLAPDPPDVPSQIPRGLVDLLLEYADLRPNLGIAIPPLRTSLMYRHIVEAMRGVTSTTKVPLFIGEPPFTPEECARDASRLLDLASRLEATAAADFTRTQK